VVDLRDTLALLSQQRPIFHSEADFQHALAWRFHQTDETARIRLEYRLSCRSANTWTCGFRMTNVRWQSS
jgi:hypothetical protein